MNMARFANAVRQQARMASAHEALPRLATISSYDASNHAVKVIVQPVDPEIGEQESNWMPLGAIGIGNGWGIAVGPQINDQVLVVYENGDFSSGVIVSRVFSVAQQPPAVPTGEIWALHSSGSFVKMVTNGDIDVNVAGNLNATVGGNMASTVAGSATVTATGSATISAASAVVQAASIKLQSAGNALQKLLNSLFAQWASTHVHSNGNGGANTGAPTTPPPASGQTSIVQAE
ncbi:phage baseplate assembly protein gpV [Paraburkholderia bannensis]|uniref:Phage baseplate assembly protein gpV n=1 Tax=Paraburkholderia bannensis TaxID=765414 RepID=A0A7W9WTE9_9BURK|nr:MULTISPECIES: phage baseplate assembly protein V [Paraburkholderia]MBB3258228.1 phage baseplate assembly protein gpV [Paraburkholderia sp. WP4_3_2]MBB6103241.1 phage baseplate assembly protein gpV [Paraburkholderia bannensis]